MKTRITIEQYDQLKTKKDQLLYAAKAMLAFSDARGLLMERTLEESQWADRLSDAIGYDKAAI